MFVARIFYFVFFAAIGVLAPYFNVYLESLGLSGVQIGWLASIPPIVALLADPFWGAIADRFQLQTAVLAGCALVTGLTALLFIPADSFWPLMVLVIMLYFFRAPIPAIADSAVMSIVSRTGVSYGRQRLWGSVGFVITSFGLGTLLSLNDLSMIFLIYGLAVGVGLFGLSFKMPIERFPGQVSLIAGVRTLARQRSYIGFLLAMVLAGIGSGGYFNFLGLHILELGGSQAQVGMAYGASAMAEIPIMFLGARWFHRYGNATLITVGLSIFTLGWMTVAAMTSPLSLIFAASLVGVGYGFFWVAVVGYANETAPEGMSATAQATVGAAQGGLGWGLGAIIGGTLWDLAGGGSAVFWTSALAGVAAIVVFRLGMRVARARNRRSELK